MEEWKERERLAAWYRIILNEKQVIYFFAQKYLPVKTDFLDPIREFQNFLKKPGENKQWHTMYKEMLAKDRFLVVQR